MTDTHEKAPDQDACESTRPDAIAALIGKHFISTDANGWQYEVSSRNERAFDSCIHDGPVAGRGMNDQAAHIVRLADGVYKWSWDHTARTFGVFITFDNSPENIEAFSYAMVSASS